MTGTPPVVLTVAGTDSGGAAGVAADVTTVAHLGAHGACVVTAVTAQDTLGVRSVHPVPLAEVVAQLDAVLEDLPVAAVKTGMVGTGAVVRALADRFAAPQSAPVVVDPVLVATSGAVLGTDEVVAAYVEHLLPVARVVTPNLDEARRLLGDHEPGAREAAVRLSELGCAVVLTGGDEGRGDWLALPGGSPLLLDHPHVDTRNDHGTGCTHAAALAAGLAHGLDLDSAARGAAAFVGDRLRRGARWRLGRGRGPVPHLFVPHPSDRGAPAPWRSTHSEEPA